MGRMGDEENGVGGSCLDVKSDFYLGLEGEGKEEGN